MSVPSDAHSHLDPDKALDLEERFSYLCLCLLTFTNSPLDTSGMFWDIKHETSYSFCTWRNNVLLTPKRHGC
jgi:hypothetical protein